MQEQTMSTEQYQSAKECALFLPGIPEVESQASTFNLPQALLMKLRQSMTESE
ncbi:hypothetical protein HMF8227_00157 [Saliniradius amylolyticus]|uniref:Uncharacterized protein n=1 Tax=Saliniradius amylolyticus TaxID=2183582 RepID=A0A2S2DZ31_9ALTE|nr:hypothetical protein [Saliniradius amylolyticus]AWL10665.1 hypothetical protein HMF8227_00157 [Saliniradius amylolyticus]